MDGGGESLVGDDELDHTRAMEECEYERYVGYYLSLMSEDFLAYTIDVYHRALTT